MVKVDLITGFLGAGKTTFIRHYARWMKEQGKSILIIENDFASIGVDTKFLKGEADAIKDMAGVCMCCKGKEIFKSMLLQAAAENVDRILVEPSGIYDVDEFFEMMGYPEMKAYCEIGSILTVVDPVFEEVMTDEASYLMFCQLLAAGKVLLSKSQIYGEAKMQETIAGLQKLVQEHGAAPLPEDLFFCEDWTKLSDADFEMLQKAGFRHPDHKKQILDHEETFLHMEMLAFCDGEEDLKTRVQTLMKEPRFGTVMRVKGHVRSLDGQWYELNCTPDCLSIRPCEVKRGVVVIIGQTLHMPEIQENAFLPKPEKA